MAADPQHQKTGSRLLRLHPLQRILLGLLTSAIAFLFTRYLQLGAVITGTILWVAFASAFIITSWIVFFKMPVDAIIEKANKEDGSRLFVMISILVSSFAGLFMVLQLMISKDQPTGGELLTVILSVMGMVTSWILVHTIFTFHYAHQYYFKGKTNTAGEEALAFPKEKNPDYLDFAYFSFVIGMTFQVSDVEINSRSTRRTALAHGLLSFALNTFVVALTINLIAGLKK